MKCAKCGQEITKRQSVDVATLPVTSECLEEIGLPKEGRICKKHPEVQEIRDAFHEVRRELIQKVIEKFGQKRVHEAFDSAMRNPFPRQRRSG